VVLLAVKLEGFAELGFAGQPLDVGRIGKGLTV
jgi:hypothetical protein